jgi:hypothetical protein
MTASLSVASYRLKRARALTRPIVQGRIDAAFAQKPVNVLCAWRVVFPPLAPANITGGLLM